MIYEEHDITLKVGEELLEDNLNNNMDNGIGKLDWANVKSALVYAVLWGLVAVGMIIYNAGGVFNLDWHKLVDAFSIAFIGFAISAVKNLLTTNSGNFLGAVKVVPEIE